ncbi:MAG: hypothetical protein ACK5GI_01640 [Ignavibacteria bacterium]|jgi:hypothetical protein
MLTTAEKITSTEDLSTFIQCYDKAYGGSILSLEFLQGCQEVYLFRDMQGAPVAGYSINTDLPYRTLDFLPAEVAGRLRGQAEGLQTYELGTIWVDAERRNGREKLELWIHIFGNVIARTDTVMVGNTISEEIYRFYSRYGMKLAHYGPSDDGEGGFIPGWVVYQDDVASSKIPEMYEALKKRLT